MLRLRVAVASTLAAVVAGLLIGAAALSMQSSGNLGDAAHLLLADVGMFAIPYVLVGLVLTVRRPDHPISWLFAGAGLCYALQTFATAYGDAAFKRGVELPAAAYVANITEWIFGPGVLLGLTLPFLLFPDGRLPSRRWRSAAAAGITGTVLFAGTAATSTDHLSSYPAQANPFGVSYTGSDALTIAGFVLYVGALFAAMAAVALRYRRSTGLARAQMRWFMVGIAFIILSFAAQAVLAVVGGDVSAPIVLMAALPICAAIAILRYRLFDIDRIISRSLAYLLVSAVLVGVYLATIGLATRVLPLSSSVSVAAATLGAAALFHPLRVRIQAFVDRRFNRSRFDASRTVDAFAARLREQVDTDVVRGDLAHTVARTLEPEHVSIWTLA